MRKTKKYIKYIIIAILLLIISAIVNISYASENIQLEVTPFSLKYQEWLELSEEEREKTIAPLMYDIDVKDNINIETGRRLLGVASKSINSRLFGTGAKYDLRDYINIIVKDQGNTEQCWSFAATTILETNLAKTQNEELQFSARHIEYATSKTFTDGTNQLGYNRELNIGRKHGYCS